MRSFEHLPKPLAALFPALVIMAAPLTAQAADPTPAECIAANERAITLRDQRQLTAARAELVLCASASCPADIRDECGRRVQEVNASLPTIVFEAKDAAGNDLTAVTITIDGKPFADQLQGNSLPLDPGQHTFLFETRGQAPLEKKLLVFEGAKDRHERINFADAAAAAPLVAPAPTAATSDTPPESSSSSGSDQRILGWTATGAGAVALGVGIVFELKRSGKLSDRDDVCPSRQDCTLDEAGRISSLTSDARSAGTVGTIGLIAGGVLVAGGLALVFTAPTSTTSIAIMPTGAPGFGGMTLTGRIW